MPLKPGAFKRIRGLIDKALSKTVPRKVVIQFREMKKEHIEDILNDPMSLEIAKGATGSSDFLKYGDLFSFFGFKTGSDPLTDLRNFLNRHIKVVPSRQMKNLRLKVKVIYPDESQFEKASKLQLPWGAGSWPVRLENGLPNLKKFVPLKNKGRSSGGLQLKNDRKTNADWKGRPYISKHRDVFLRKVKAAIQ